MKSISDELKLIYNRQLADWIRYHYKGNLKKVWVEKYGIKGAGDIDLFVDDILRIWVVYIVGSEVHSLSVPRISPWKGSSPKIPMWRDCLSLTVRISRPWMAYLPI